MEMIHEKNNWDEQILRRRPFIEYLVVRTIVQG
jgi:hypothetical protein